MYLTLVAISLNDQPLSQPITAVFDARGGTIGRADHNTMALPDPQRHVSRLQAEIVVHGASFIIRNVGAANPILVDGRTLANGETAALAQDEQIRIGGYLLQARVSEAEESTVTVHPHRPQTWAPPAQTVAAPLTPTPPAPARRPASPTADPFADLLGPPVAAAAANPFADLLGPTETRTPSASDPFADLMPAPAGVDPRSAAVAPTPAPAPLLPDDFDPFATPAAPARVDAPPRHADPFADLMPASSDTSIDRMFGLGASGDADPLSRFLGGAAHAAPAGADGVAGSLSTDPLALFSVGAPAPAPPVVMAQPDNVSALNGAFALPLQAKPTPAATPSAPHPPEVAVASAPTVILRTPSTAASPAAALDNATLWAAFCAGAGIAPVAPAGTPEQQMHELGRILRSAVDGILQLIAVRASTKHELRAGVTVIQQRNNNPLKFSPDAAAALAQLLQPPMRGFLDGPTAMDDAMHDLVGHSIGTVAGLRAAVEGMLDRFAPQALEAKLTSHSVFDSLLPANRKARLWDLYLEHHESIREEAQEDFHTLFGKAFLAAYQQQIERLQRRAAQR